MTFASRRSIMKLLLLALALVTVPAVVSAAPAPGGLRAGAATSNITPPIAAQWATTPDWVTRLSYAGRVQTLAGKTGPAKVPLQVLRLHSISRVKREGAN